MDYKDSSCLKASSRILVYCYLLRDKLLIKTNLTILHIPPKSNLKHRQ
jgi:hypothetical protein